MEIGVCFLLCKHIYQVARDKNYNPIGFIIGTICTWLIAEGIAGGVSLYFVKGLLFVYLASLIGGFLGGLLWFVIIHMIPSRRYNPENSIIFDAYRLRHIEDPPQATKHAAAESMLNSAAPSGSGPSAAAPISPEPQSHCPICLEPVENTAEFCRTCGYKLHPD